MKPEIQASLRDAVVLHAYPALKRWAIFIGPSGTSGGTEIAGASSRARRRQRRPEAVELRVINDGNGPSRQLRETTLFQGNFQSNGSAY